MNKTRKYIKHILLYLSSTAISKTNSHAGHDHSSSLLDASQQITNDDISHLTASLPSFQNKKPKDMTKEEKLFFVFKSADIDNDDRLDGLEIMQSMIKFQEEDYEFYGKEPEIKEDEEWILELDAALKMQDLDNDGYVSYGEFFALRSKKIDAYVQS